MLINESYFDDLEIKDEDTVVPDDSSYTPSQDSVSNINKANSHFQCTVLFRLFNANFDKKEENMHRFEPGINRTISKLYTMFELFDIDCSRAYVLDGYSMDFYHIGLSLRGNPNDTVVEHRRNYTLISTKKESCSHHTAQYYNNHDYNHTIVMYFNKPKFRDIRELLRFIQVILNIHFTGGNFDQLILYDYFYSIYSPNKEGTAKCFGNLWHNDAMSYIKQLYYKRESFRKEYDICNFNSIFLFFFSNNKWQKFVEQFKNYKTGQPINYNP